MEFKELDSLSINLIIETLIQLPSDVFLTFELSSDQKEHWKKMRRFNQLKAKYQSSLHFGTNDILPECVDKNIINESERLQIMTTVSFYNRLWELVHSAEPYLRKDFKTQGIEYPLSCAGNRSSLFLYLITLTNIIDTQYSQCLSKYFTRTTADIRLITLLPSALSSRKLAEYKKTCEKLTQNQEEFYCLISFCEQLAKKDLGVRMRLKALGDAMIEMSERLNFLANLKRDSSKSQKVRSYIWDDGLLKIGAEGGNYTPFHQEKKIS